MYSMDISITVTYFHITSANVNILKTITSYKTVNLIFRGQIIEHIFQDQYIAQHLKINV